MTTLEAFNNEFIKELWGVFGIGIAACGVLLIKIIRDFLISILKNFYKKLRKKSTFKETVGLMRYINDKLVELRTKVCADRAYIQEFKNGDYFSAKNPVWRVFRTYEKCQDGIIYQGNTINGEQVTTIFDIVEPVLVGTTKNTGVHIMDCSKCDLPCKDHNVVIYDVINMRHTASRQMLQNHTVKVTVQTNLMVKDNIVGILAIDFCDELSEAVVHDEKWVQECCKTISMYADKIEYCLANPSKFKS